MQKKILTSPIIFFIFAFYCLVLLGTILVIGYILYDDQAIKKSSETSSNFSHNFNNANKIVRAKNFSSYDDTAFAFLALGAQAHQMNCPAAIESLVKFAGWNGNVYLITDRESCFDRNVTFN
jgi:hypothetical protein